MGLETSSWRALAGTLGALLVLACVMPASAAALRHTPVALNFGSVTAGSIRELPLTIRNNDGEAVQLGQAAFDSQRSSAYALSSDGCSGHSLEADESCQLWVRLTVPDTGSIIGRLVLPSDHGSVTVRLQASRPRQPQLELSEGPMTTRSPLATLTFTASSPGSTAPVLSLSGQDAGAFSVESNTCAGAPQTSCTFTIRFTGTDAGFYGASASVFDGDLSNEIELEAIGTLSKPELLRVLRARCKQALRHWRADKPLSVGGLRLRELGELRLEVAAGARRLGLGRATYEGRGAGKVRVRLGKAGKALLQRKPDTRVTVTLTFVADADGERLQARFRVPGSQLSRR